MSCAKIPLEAPPTQLAPTGLQRAVAQLSDRDEDTTIGRAPINARYSAAATLVRSGSTSALTTIVLTTTAAPGETSLTAQQEPRSACATLRGSNPRSRSHPRSGAGARVEAPLRVEPRRGLVPAALRRLTRHRVYRLNGVSVAAARHWSRERRTERGRIPVAPNH